MNDKYDFNGERNTSMIDMELSRIEKLSSNGVDVSLILREMSEKIEVLRRQADEMIDLIYNQEAEASDS